jgi:oligopeptide/dipeptide ABC transporter ATP-binding protein
MSDGAILEVHGLQKHFSQRGGVFGHRGMIRAVDGVDLTIHGGETVGLVGESGSGKSTLGRSILRLIEPTAGSVFFQGEDWLALSSKQLQKRRRGMQIIFQDPHSSLNPRMKVGDIIGEGLLIHKIARGKERQERIRELMERVGLAQAHYDRYPHEFSGGQLQRVGIARALAVEPSFVVADEPVSSLDVSIQAQIINLLRDLQREIGLTYLFIAHDLRVVEHISQRVAIMYLGRIVETAPKDAIFRNPRHPYTQALLASIPPLEPTKKQGPKPIEGELPDPSERIEGCRFRTRCPYRQKLCEEVDPPLRKVEDSHLAACHFA